MHASPALGVLAVYEASDIEKTLNRRRSRVTPREQCFRLAFHLETRAFQHSFRIFDSSEYWTNLSREKWPRQKLK